MGPAPPGGRASPLEQSKEQGAGFGAILAAMGLQAVTPAANPAQPLSLEAVIALTRLGRVAEAGLEEAGSESMLVADGAEALPPGHVIASLVQQLVPQAPAVGLAIGRGADHAPTAGTATGATASLPAVANAVLPQAAIEVRNAVPWRMAAVVDAAISTVSVPADAVAVRPSAASTVPQASAPDAPVEAPLVATMAGDAQQATATALRLPAADDGAAAIAPTATTRLASATDSPEVGTPMRVQTAGSGADGGLGSEAQARGDSAAMAVPAELSDGFDRPPVVVSSAAQSTSVDAPAITVAGGESANGEAVVAGIANVAAPAPAVVAEQRVENVGGGELKLGASSEANSTVPAQLADTVRGAIRVGQQEIRLRLDPPDLGHLDVRVVESSDGIRVTLTAQSREVGELMQLQLPALRASLEARDLRVDRLDVIQLDLAEDANGGTGSRDRTMDDGTGDDAPTWSPLGRPADEDSGQPVERTGPTGLASSAVDLMA